MADPRPDMEYMELGLVVRGRPPKFHLWIIWKDGRARAREVALLRQVVPELAKRPIPDILHEAKDTTRWYLGRFNGVDFADLEPRAKALGLALTSEKEELNELLQRARTSPDKLNVRDLYELAVGFGFAMHSVSGRHTLYQHKATLAFLSIQDVGGKAKPYQVRQFLNLVERYNLQLEPDADAK